MSMNIRQNDAVNGVGSYSTSQSRGKQNSLQNLSSGFRIDNGPAKVADPAARDSGSRMVTLERAVRTAAQSANVQSVSQNALNERNADLVRQRAQTNKPASTSGMSGAGQIDAYA